MKMILSGLENVKRLRRKGPELPTKTPQESAVSMHSGCDLTKAAYGQRTHLEALVGFKEGSEPCSFSLQNAFARKTTKPEKVHSGCKLKPKKQHCPTTKKHACYT